MVNSNIKISKKLTWLLRHGDPSETRLNIRCDGFVDVVQVLKHFNDFSLKDLISVVNNDKKHRFSLIEEDDKLLIRANQGHSFSFIDDEKLLNQIILSKNSSFLERIIIHGTYLDKWEAIERTGLSRMSRSHIHFVSARNFKLFNFENANSFTENIKFDEIVKELCNCKCISGIRSSANVLIFLDMYFINNLDKSIKFYVSENGIILTKGNQEGCISSKLFLFCVDLKNRCVLLNNARDQIINSI